MDILTTDNNAFSMNELPDEIDNIRFCVLDYTDPKNVDYIWIPLIWLESFNSPAIELKIGNDTVLLPYDWNIVIADKDSGESEILNLKQINDRNFDAFVMNPINGYMPDFKNIEITNIYQDIKWFVPQLKYGHILSVPIQHKKNPECIYIVKETKKIPDSLDITQMV